MAIMIWTMEKGREVKDDFEVGGDATIWSDEE
jgi:hypothetical protein